jgi:exodeoxyribonuclease V alpha subunit
MTATAGPETRQPTDPRVAARASGVLAELNLAGVLDAADVHVARRLSRLGHESDERVLLAVALAVRAVRGGSLCLDLDAVPGLDPSLADVDPAAWAAALGASPLTSAGVLHLDAGRLYLGRYWQEESQVVDDLTTRDTAAPSVDEGALTAALAAYFPDEASGDQRAAAEVACRRCTSVVTGGPGTGKTTTIARLLGVLLSLEGEQPLRIALAAPTGKAAARMGQALRAATARDDFPGSDGADPAAAARRDRIHDLPASTLHRLLGWRPDSATRFRHDRANPLPYDVVVVDETSMMSLTLAARLLEAMRPQARLVLVGDADQLASVEAGAVLGDIVEGWSGHGPVRTLGLPRRFGAHIRELAEAIKAGAEDDVLALLTEGRGAHGDADGRVLREETGPDLDARLRDHALGTQQAAVARDVTGMLARFEAHRLLCAHREGPFGAAWWNRHVERLLMDATHQEWWDEWYPGRPFIVNANDQGLRLWNGDTGVAMPRDAATTLPLVGVVGDTATVSASYPTTRLADVSTAHAMTVHRAQGSQFAEVTVLLPEPDSRILTRELFYTAVTRATSVVRVVGSDDAIRAAVTRRAQRATGLATRLATTP